MYLPTRSTAASRTAGEESASLSSRACLTYVWKSQPHHMHRHSRRLTRLSTSGSAVMMDERARRAFDLKATTVESSEELSASRIGSKAD